MIEQVYFRDTKINEIYVSLLEKEREKRNSYFTRKVNSIENVIASIVNYLNCLLRDFNFSDMTDNECFSIGVILNYTKNDYIKEPYQESYKLCKKYRRYKKLCREYINQTQCSFEHI
jgi:hypothetical protein